LFREIETEELQRLKQDNASAMGCGMHHPILQAPIQERDKYKSITTTTYLNIV